jgi:predicted permease
MASLAIGISINTLMFSIMDALLFRPPGGVQNAAELHRVLFRSTIAGAPSMLTGQSSFPVYADLRASARSVAGVAAYATADVPLGEDAGWRDVHAQLVSPGFFTLLGTAPRLGRFFSSDEDSLAGGRAVVVISERLWRTFFGGTSDVLGRQVRVGGHAYEVIGVAGPEFTGPELRAADLWLPLAVAGADYYGRGWERQRYSYLLSILVRSRGTAVGPGDEAELNRAFAEASLLAGESPGVSRIVLSPIQPGRAPGGTATGRLAVWLSILSALVLGVACANTLGLLLTRVLTSRHEIALRIALGARRANLSADYLREGVLLTGGGLALAWLMGTIVAPPLARFLLPGTEIPTLLGGRAVAYGAVLSALLALVCAAAPILRAGQPDIAGALVSTAQTAPLLRSRARSAVVLLQVALSFVLVVSAGLMTKSLHNIRSIRSGFDADSVLVVTVDVRGSGYSLAAIDEIFRQFQERARALPGVAGASVASAIPFLSGAGYTVWLPGNDLPPSMPTGVPLFSAVTPDYFATMGTKILSGRSFSPADGPAPRPTVAIVNQTMARFLWNGQDAVGRCLRLGEADAPCTTIIGVAEDARLLRLREDPRMLFYVPLNQVGADARGRALFIRAAGDPEALRARVETTLQHEAPDSPPVRVRILWTLTDPDTMSWRMGASMFGVFGLLSVCLAAVGLYGLLASDVQRRRRELGVRLALGADRTHLVRIVVTDALRVTGLAVATGLLLALLVGRAIGALLYQVSPADVGVLAGSTAVFLLVAMAASLVPSVSAASMSPMAILRDE